MPQGLKETHPLEDFVINQQLMKFSLFIDPTIGDPTPHIQLQNSTGWVAQANNAPRLDD